MSRTAPRVPRRRPAALAPEAASWPASQHGFDRDCSCRRGWVAFRAALAAAVDDDPIGAEPLLREAARCEPFLLAPTELLRGRLLLRQGELDAAIRAFRAGLRLTPNAPLLHVSLGHALMLRGDYAQGWEALEWRRRVDFGPVTFFPPMPGPEWQGESFPGTLLVRAEQGMGDCIMLARYLPAVSRRVGRVVLACHRPLVPLFAALPGVSEIVELEHGVLEFDRWAFLNSIPRLFATTLDSIPFAAGFLQPDPARRGAWAALLPAGPKIGLVWAGNPEKEEDGRRSIRFATMQRLLGVPGLRFVSLQVGRAAEQAAGMPDLLQLGAGLGDFAETAAVVAELDLVISVDTAVAHLAGALGRPCWLLLPEPPDWRWLLGRTDSPWYTSLRLFRQARPGDWDGVIGCVADALARFAPRFRT